jgi:N-acetylglucosaminyl-diphospho-decaprenol L-rhamnosyltransferase
VTLPTEALAVTAVVSNMNGAAYLPRLLDTLTAQSGVETEIIVVDRHSSDASLEILARYPAVRVVQEPPESGLVAGYAVGARHASNPLLFFCNEDVYLEENCLRELASRIDLKRRIGAADPWQWSYDGEKCQHRGTLFRRSPWHIYSPFPFRMYEAAVALPDGSPISFGCAGHTMVHASVYNELGGWDASFFLDYEDVDLYLRAWQRGWKCVTVPSAHVFHAVGASNQQVIGRRRQPVSRRRYISHRSNVVVVAFKYFSPAVSALGVLNWGASLLVNVLLLRWRTVWLDLVVVGDVARRVPAVAAFRRRNRRWNRDMPGERFFLDPQFSLDQRVVS